jgi:TolB-like protein
MRNTLTSACPGEAPSDERIRQQLARILASAEFVVPQRSRRLFKFIVDETLCGRGGSLKAFSIAQDVFDRDASFDAQNDPCVRITAGQVRSALERYYLIAGSADDVLIMIPKGQYAAAFKSRSLAQVACESDDNVVAPAETALPKKLGVTSKNRRWMVGAAAAVAIAFASLTFAIDLGQRDGGTVAVSAKGRPSILVESPTVAGGDDSSFSIGFRDEVITALAKEQILVFSSGKTKLPATPTFAMQSGVQTDGSDLRVNVRVVRTVDGVVVWAAGYHANLKAEKTLDIQANIAGSLALAIARPIGMADGQVAVARPDAALYQWR